MVEERRGDVRASYHQNRNRTGSTESAPSGKIGEITPQGSITEFPIPTASSYPTLIAMGPDGNLWFDEWMGRIGRMTPTGSYVEYTMSASNAEMAGIAPGPDGNVWFTEGGIGSRVGFVTMAGVVKELPPLQRIPSGITAGPDGNMWFGCTGAICAYRLA